MTTYTYDGAGNLTQITRADGTTESWVYDAALNRPTSYTDPLGRVTSWTYDAAGNVLSVTDPDGNATVYTYDARGLITSITQPDPDGPGPLPAPVTSYTYDAYGRLIALTNPDGSTQQFAYDAADNLTSVTDELGRVTTYSYDALDRLVSVTAPDPDGSGPLAAPVTSFAYDAAGRMISQTDPAGNVTSYTYDANGNLLSVTQPDPDGAGPLAAPVSTYTYDAAGRKLTETDPLGNITTYTYTSAGELVTSITFPDPDGSGPQTAPVITYDYDSIGRRTKVTDPLGNVTTYAYDAMNRVTSITDAAGGVTAFTYDAAGNRTGVTDPLGNTTSYTFDALDRVVSVTQPDPDGPAGPLSAPTTSYTFDNLGRITSVTDPLGNVTSYGYDIRSRRTSVTDATGNTTIFAFDAAGNLTAVTDPLGNVTTYAYDNLNRRTSTTDAAGGVTTFTYDILGNRTSLTDPVGNTTTFAYDNLSRLASETNALGQTRTYAWDAASNLTSRTDRAGRTIEFSYDNLSRRTQERWLDADGTTVVHTIDWTYDANSQVTSLTDNDSSYTFAYDALGRLTSVDNAGTPDAPNVVLAYGYDAAGRRTSASATIDGTADFQNTYQFDNLGRVTRIEQTAADPMLGNAVGDKRIDLTYTDRGQFASITRYEDLAGTNNVAQSTFSYDAAGRLISLDHSTVNAQPSTLAAYSWTYDAAGRITSATTPDGTTTYSYDATGQLTAADHSYQADETYSYDANGNRLGAQASGLPGGSATYTTGTNNQLLSDGTYNYQYDAEGNRTKKTNIATGDSVEYTWDHWNRLTQVTFKNSAGVITKVAAYTYDALNRRIAKKVDDNGDGTFDRAYRFVYDHSGKPDPATGVPLDDVVLVFEDSSGSGSGPWALDSRLLHGPAIDQIFASEDAAGDIFWALADHQGTVRDWIDYDAATDTTTIVNHLKYDSFGNITAIEDAAGNPSTLHSPLSTPHYAYTGRLWDADAQLYYNRARWYDPAIGRFISEDPLGFAAGDANIQRYVFNSPTNLNDPSGLDDISIAFDEDWKTWVADWWNTISTGFDGITIDNNNPDWDKAIEQLDEFDDGSIDGVLISGHGAPGTVGGININDLKDESSKVHEFFEKLGDKLTDDAEIEIRACQVASGETGKCFIKELAEITGADVTAYDDWYAIKPYGTEWTAKPDGTVEEGEYHGAFNDSWIHWWTHDKKHKKNK